MEGQPLVTLDSPDADAAISTYLQADATLRQAKVALTKTQTDLERARKLLQYPGNLGEGRPSRAERR